MFRGPSFLTSCGEMTNLSVVPTSWLSFNYCHQQLSAIHVQKERNGSDVFSTNGEIETSVLTLAVV